MHRRASLPARSARARKDDAATGRPRLFVSWRDLASLETCFLLFLFSGRFKTMPELHFIPIDLTPLFLVATVFLLGRAIAGNQLRLLPASLHIVLMILFSELAAVSLFWSSLTGLNIDKLARFLLFTVPSYFMACMIAQDPVRRDRLVRMTAWVSCAILAYYAYYRYALGIEMEKGASTTSAEVPVNADNYLEYAEHATYLFIILLVSGVLGTGRQLAGAVLGIGMASFLLLSLGGRGPLILSLISVPLLGLVLMVRLRARRGRLTRLAIVTTGVLGLAAIAYLTAEQSGINSAEVDSSFRTLDRIESQLSGEDTVSLDKRSQGRQFATQQWLAKPILGWGIGEFRVYDNELRYPHNLLLEILMELGIVGGVLFFSSCMISLRACLQIARDKRAGWAEIAIALLFMSELISHFTVEGYLADDRIFFALAGMAIGARAQWQVPHMAARAPLGGQPMPRISGGPRFAAERPAALKPETP